MLWSQCKLATKRCTEFLCKKLPEFQKIANWNSDFRTLQKSEFQKKNPTGIFRIVNGIGIPPPMGVPEIGTKNRNSQPRVALYVGLTCGYGWCGGVCGALRRNCTNALGTCSNIKTCTFFCMLSQLMSIPRYLLPSQSIAQL